MHSRKSPKISFIREIKRTLIVIASVVLLSWGISYADTLPSLRDLLKENATQGQRTFSTMGHIGSIEDFQILIFDAKNPEGESGFSYVVDARTAHIKSQEGGALTFSDLKEDQVVIAKGLLQENTISAHTLIIMPHAEINLEEVATSTDAFATSTDVFASTTDAAASSTQDSPNAEEASPSTDTLIGTVIDTVTDVIDTVVESVTDSLSGIIDTLTGTSTPAVEDTASTTESEINTSTSETEETSTSTESNVDTAIPVTEDTAPTPESGTNTSVPITEEIQEEAPVEQIQEEALVEPIQEEVKQEETPEPEPNLEVL